MDNSSIKFGRADVIIVPVFLAVAYAIARWDAAGEHRGYFETDVLFLAFAAVIFAVYAAAYTHMIYRVNQQMLMEAQRQTAGLQHAAFCRNDDGRAS